MQTIANPKGRRMTPGSRLLISTAPWRRLVLVAVVTVIVVTVGGLLLKLAGHAELPLSQSLNRLHHGAVATMGDLLYKWAGPLPAIAATVVLTAIILLVSRDLRVASTFAVTIAVTWLSMAVIKLAVDRPRPDPSQLSLPYRPIQHDASFPSGHAAFLTIFVICLVGLISGNRARIVAAVIAIVAIAGAGLLLTIDAVHYPTDVLASVLWVLGVGPLVRAAWVRGVMPRIPFLRRGPGTGRRSVTRSRAATPPA